MADIILPPKKNVIMDATTLSSLMSCGRYYDLRFNHRFVSMRGKSNSLEIGTLFHKVMEVYYRHIIQGFPRTTAIGQAMTAGQMWITGCPSCANLLDEKPSCGHETGEYPGVTNTPEANEGKVIGWKFVMDTAEAYFEHYKNDAFVPLAAEVVKGDVLYEDDEIRVLWKAKIDLLIDQHQVGVLSMDHKTFKQNRKKNTLGNQFTGQCCLLKTRNVLVNKIGWQTTYKIADRLSRELVSYSADRLFEWQSEILPYYAYKFIDYQESGYWPPDYTHCETMYGPCAFMEVCEADRNMRVEVLRNEFQLAPKWDPTNNREDE